MCQKSIRPNPISYAYQHYPFAGQVLAMVQSHGYGIEDVTTREADLEDVFVQLTGAG